MSGLGLPLAEEKACYHLSPYACGLARNSAEVDQLPPGKGVPQHRFGLGQTRAGHGHSPTRPLYPLEPSLQ